LKIVTALQGIVAAEIAARAFLLKEITGIVSESTLDYRTLVL
jgi:hypothetical protein